MNKRIELMKKMIMMKIEEIMKWRVIKNWENEVKIIMIENEEWK